MSMLRVVLDTNVLLVSISDRSRLHWIFQKLLKGEYMICVTTDILAEYAEIIEKHMGTEASESTMGVLENLPNIILTTNYFRFHLLKDEDDNKFVDCAIAANADYIVTNDRHFNVLQEVEFPAVNVINIGDFQSLLDESGHS
ncbi:MAG: putative toxin-antitoxin system toxin component, PIN family [Caldilineaceae bacterium]|nr:putative toxin-antitoxin system toxin component, PIN family [Caldilineaceae bacterium]